MGVENGGSERSSGAVGGDALAQARAEAAVARAAREASQGGSNGESKFVAWDRQAQQARLEAQSRRPWWSRLSSGLSGLVNRLGFRRTPGAGGI